jgi:hypothetical protein
VYIGNTVAPRGHFIIDAFSRDRAVVTTTYAYVGTGTITAELDKNRPTTNEFYAGRVWYAGCETDWVSTRGPSNNSNIYFSQILTDVKKAGRCYQDGDPTAETANELLSNDGGIIRIPEVGVIKRLLATQQYLLVFADNGVWTISGALDSGFTADDFQVRKVSDIGVLSPNSVVLADGKTFYWSDGGVYVVLPDQISGNLNVQNVTETTIQTFFNNIPYENKKYAWGNYDPFTKKVAWAYSTDADFDGTNERFKYNAVLELDLVLQAFSPITVSSLASETPYITGFIQTPDSSRTYYDLDISDSTGVLVVDAAAAQVTVERVSTTQGTSNSKFLTMVPEAGSASYRYTFSLFNNPTFTDWVTKDGTGVDFKSYLETGIDLFGDMVRDKQAHRIWMYFTRTETGYTANGADQMDFANPSGAFVSTRWDFSGSGSSGKWSPKKQMYRLKKAYMPENSGDSFDYGYDVVVAEDSLRGQGKGLSLYIESETGKDMQLLGWAIQASLNRNP